MSEVLRRKEERRKKRTNAVNDDVSTHGSFSMLIYYVLSKINIINLIHFLELLTFSNWDYDVTELCQTDICVNYLINVI